MSHSKERKEKICLNCRAELYGFYCHQCGQDNIEPRQTVWHLVGHFFADITHFDGKFFTTVKDLIVKPGFLSLEYTIGRRARYLHPIRMYVFTSAFFFLVFFSLFNPKKINLDNGAKIGKYSYRASSLDSAKNEALKEADDAADSASVEKTFQAIRKEVEARKKDSVTKENDTVHIQAVDRSNTILPDVTVSLDPKEFKTIEAYDSAQARLPEASRDGMFRRIWKHKKIELEDRYRQDKKGFIKEWIETFLHSFPKLLFLSLPMVALLLKLIYIRKRQFYYVDHGIFAIHIYIYSFLALLILFGFNALQSMTGWALLNWLITGMVIFSFYYYYKAMRVFYGQGRLKTFAKYLMLFFLSFILILFLFSFFILFSIFEI